MLEDLADRNERLLRSLLTSGVPPERVIYVSFDDAGGSSSVVLNLVRDKCRLERRGCHFVDGRDVKGILQRSSDVGSGAIVYVDDFIGTGRQFLKARDYLAPYIIGSFSEYLLVHTICEEGVGALAKVNSVDPIQVRIHTRIERPLHDLGRGLDAEAQQFLRQRCLEMNPKNGLGFGALATMTVFYRNAPNTVPLLLRGHKDQKALCGVLPRSTDLAA